MRIVTTKIKNVKKFFKKKFKKVWYELEYLESKIDLIDGIIFKNHRFSQKELINSPHHKRIDSITRKIGDDAYNWHVNGMLSEKDIGIYEDIKEEIEIKLNHINNLIETRQSTWWESMKGELNYFVIKICKNMPVLSRILIEVAKVLNLPYLGKITTPLLLMFDKSMR